MEPASAVDPATAPTPPIEGSLRDVSISDVLQFAHLGRRSGTLRIGGDARHAVVIFHRGKITGAWMPWTPRLGDLLAARGLIDRSTLEECVETSVEQQTPIGQRLLALGVVDARSIRDALTWQITDTIKQLILWRSGSFRFSLNETCPHDDVGFAPKELLPEIEPSTLLLEASQGTEALQALARRDPIEGSIEEQIEAQIENWPSPEVHADEAEPVAPDPTTERLQLFVASADTELVVDLEHQLSSLNVDVVRTQPADLAELGVLGRPGTVLLDLRLDDWREVLTQVRLARPHDPLLCIVDDPGKSGAAFASGAISCLPPRPITIAAGLRNVVKLVQHSRPQLAYEKKLSRLKNRLDRFRDALRSTSVTLSVLNLVADSAERAIFFEVDDDRLTAIGAFGKDCRGRNLATRIQGLQLSRDAHNLLSLSVEHSRALSMSIHRANLPVFFLELVGEPRSAEVLALPLVGRSGAAAVLYVDNGNRPRPLEDPELLELATWPAGVDYERDGATSLDTSDPLQRLCG